MSERAVKFLELSINFILYDSRMKVKLYWYCSRGFKLLDSHKS